MRVASTQIDIDQKVCEIYLAGCNPPWCDGCHNPELHRFDIGTTVNSTYVTALAAKVVTNAALIDTVWVLGGEPLDQDSDTLYTLLDAMQGTGKDVWVWTRNVPADVPLHIQMRTDYIKTGAYDKDNRPGAIEHGISMASTNQHVWEGGVDYTTNLDNKISTNGFPTTYPTLPAADPVVQTNIIETAAANSASTWFATFMDS